MKKINANAVPICIERLRSMLIRHSKYADNNDLPNVPDGDQNVGQDGELL